MRTGNKAVRQSVSLPAKIAAQVRTMARVRRLSANRMLVDLIENGIEAEKEKKKEVFSTSPSASGMPPIRKKSNDWVIRWAGWSSATDAEDRELGQSAGGRPRAL